MKFSIIVLAYNIESYIEACLHSLLRQSYRRFEVIVVDDASTDGTLDAIGRAIGRDDRFTVVHAPANRGRHLSRKLGVSYTTGDWVLFVDGDDSLKPDALQTLAAQVEHTSADLVYFGRDVIAQREEDRANAAALERLFNVDCGALTGDAIVEAAFSPQEGRVPWTMISLAIRRATAAMAFAAMSDSRMGRMEDAYEFLVLCDHASRMEFRTEHLLNYEWGRGITGAARQSLRRTVRNIEDIAQVLTESQRYAQSRGTRVCEAAVEWMARHFPQHISTELVLRGSVAVERDAFLAFSRVWGTDVAVGELHRLLIDRANVLAAHGGDAGDDELNRLLSIRDFLMLTRTPSPAGFAQSPEHYEALRAKSDAAIRALPAREPSTMRKGTTMTDKTIDADSTNRLAIFCFYDKHGHAASFIRHVLDDLTRNIRELVVVVNGTLDAQSEALFRRYTDTVIVRENRGLDVAAYRQALLHVGWKRLETFDEVICLNDTVLGPVFPFRDMFRTMGARNVDFWGITAYAGETVNDEVIPTHLQAYWHVYRRSLVSSEAFHRYWENMPIWTSYAEVTRKHEMRFTKHFEDLGFTWDSYVDWRKYAGVSSYPLLYMPATLVRDDRCPVFKRRSFFLPYDFTFEQTAGQPALDLYDYLREHTTFDVDLIWDAILPAYNIYDIQRAMHLDYVLPADADNPQARRPVRSAFIYHIYFLDLLDDTMHYIEQLPDEVDLYITTTPDKIAAIREAFDSRGITRRPTFIQVVNRGRDVSALLVAAKDVVLDGGYDVIGFAHDKKSSQNQQAGHHGTETQGFAYKLLENTLGSTTYVRNILRLFASNPRLGLLCPPPPYHALYFAHTRPVDWGPNFAATKELLEDRLDVHVNLDSSKPTVSAIGSCYWFRVDALRPLFEAGWTYEDFLPEGQMGGDGSISHAIERANGYVAQSQGYYPAWVMSDRYARIEVDSLYYVTDTLLRGMGPFRQGETVLQTANALGSRLSSQGRIRRQLRRRIHSGLKWFTHRFVLPLPESLRDVLYHAGWLPINTYRRMRNAIADRRRQGKAKR